MEVKYSHPLLKIEEGVAFLDIGDGFVVKIDDTLQNCILLSNRGLSLYQGKISVQLPPTISSSGKKVRTNLHSYLLRNYGMKPGLMVYHIDGDECNNCLSNLRLVTQSELRKLKANLPICYSGIYRGYKEWIIELGPANEHHKYSIKDSDCGDNIDSSYLAATKVFSEQRSQTLDIINLEKRDNDILRITDPEVHVSLSTPQQLDTLNNVIILNNLVIVTLTQGKKMIADKIPEVWNLLRKHRFFAHRDHNVFYCTTNINGKTWSFHKLLDSLVSGTGPVIDHINGNGLDNRLRNLRRVSLHVNKRNSHKPYKNSRTGVTGLHLVKGAYRISWTDDNGETQWRTGFTISEYGSLDIARLHALQTLENEKSKVRLYNEAYKK